MIELVDVTKQYGDTPAVRGVTLTVARGELLAILGESGSGKTTLLKMVNRLIDPDRGTVRIDGADVRGEDPVALRRTIGYVIQHVGLLPHLSVADNIAIVPRLLGWTEDEVRALFFIQLRRKLNDVGISLSPDLEELLLQVQPVLAGG